MKKLLFLFILTLLPTMASADADPGESLYGEWRLVGWNDGGTDFEVDNSYVSKRGLSIEFSEEGYVTAYSMVNQICLGILTLNGNEMIFDGDRMMTEVYCDVMENLFFEDHIRTIKSYQLDGHLLRLYYTDNDYFVFTSDINDGQKPEESYRPFIEEGKVWKVGEILSNPVQMVYYYYFDGDTIIDGKACRQMMCRQYASPEHPNYDSLTQGTALSYVGAWYEEDRKVYAYDADSRQFEMMYDFSAAANDTLQFKKDGQDYLFAIGPRQTGGLNGFKGVYREVSWCDDWGGYYSPTWLEGVGSIDSPTTNAYFGYVDPLRFLMSCTVGDEVIYLNDSYEDGATPEVMGARARKQRFDFTHTIKVKPKARQSRGEDGQPADDAEATGITDLYGEYSQQRLDINLDRLSDTYQVRITDASGKDVYEKVINAGSVVGLNIDISSLAKDHFTVTVENGYESFTGEFNTQTTGIETITTDKEDTRRGIYNLHGQRISSLQKGLNIVNGRKVFVK